jgi:hypothetical protein
MVGPRRVATIEGVIIMKRQLQLRLAMPFAVAIAIGLSGAAAFAQQAPQRRSTEVQQQSRAQERIYGEDLMTSQERNAYHERMRQLETEQERAAYRSEHAKEMQSRAAQRGVTLPPQAAQTRPGEARQGPSPSGREQSPSERSRQQDTQRNREMHEDRQRDRDMHEPMMRDQPSTGARKPQGNRR